MIKSKNSFKPAWWLRNSHLQTIWPALWRRKFKNLPLERERIELPDGDFIDLDWLRPREKVPTLLVLHGLEGSIESHYAQGMLQKVFDCGWRGVFMHFRGCSGEPNRLPRGYHSGETGDLKYIVRMLRERDPDVPIAAMGVSLGGNVLLKWLGETGAENPLRAAIAVSVPFDLQKAAAHIQQGFSRFYQWYFIKYLRERLSKKFRGRPAFLDISHIHNMRTMYEFDENITAPLHGFTDAREYYIKSSSRQYLKHIQVPTLIIHAKDDPFMSRDVIPEKHELSPKIRFELTEAGGHVGFVGGKFPWKPEYWLEECAAEFLREQFSK